MEIDNKIIGELVREIQNGNMSAFNQLYETVSPRSFFVALQIVKNKQDAEDILQESFISALEKINTLESPESFVGWFNRIVANKSKDYLKKKKPMLFDEEEKQVFELIPDEDREFSPQENLNDKETRKLIFDAVNELSDEKRICVLLHYYNNMSIAEIAETVGSNENTVKSRLYQARKDLSAKFSSREKLYSISPIALVLWMWRGFEFKLTENFAGSPESANILSNISAKAGIGAAATAVADMGFSAMNSSGFAVNPSNYTPNIPNNYVPNYYANTPNYYANTPNYYANTPNYAVNTAKKASRKAAKSVAKGSAKKVAGKAVKKASMSIAQKIAIGAVVTTIGLGVPATGIGVGVVASNSSDFEIGTQIEELLVGAEESAETAIQNSDIIDTGEKTLEIDLSKYVVFVPYSDDGSCWIEIDSEAFAKEVSKTRMHKAFKELNIFVYLLDLFFEGGPQGGDFFKLTNNGSISVDIVTEGQLVNIEVDSPSWFSFFGTSLDEILEALNIELKSTSFTVRAVIKEKSK